MTGFRDLRHNHDFTVLWIGQTVSELGTQVSMFVVPAGDLRGHRVGLPGRVAGGLDLLGMALALLPGGLLADRVHRGRLMRTRVRHRRAALRLARRGRRPRRS